MTTAFSTLTVLLNFYLHFYILKTSQSQIKASFKSHHTHLWLFPKLHFSPQVPWLLQEGKPRCANLWYASVAPARCNYTAPQKGLISASSSLPFSCSSSTAPAWGTKCVDLLELFISPVSYCDIFIRISGIGKGGSMGFFPFINAHLEQYLLEETHSTLEDVVVARVEPRGWHSSFQNLFGITMCNPVTLKVQMPRQCILSYRLVTFLYVGLV